MLAHCEGCCLIQIKRLSTEGVVLNDIDQHRDELLICPFKRYFATRVPITGTVKQDSQSPLVRSSL